MNTHEKQVIKRVTPVIINQPEELSDCTEYTTYALSDESGLTAVSLTTYCPAIALSGTVREYDCWPKIGAVLAASSLIVIYTQQIIIKISGVKNVLR